MRKKKALPELTRVQEEIVAHLISSIAFGTYDDTSLVENLAEQFHRAANRFLPTLRKLADKGYLRIEGEAYPRVYPTIEALRKQNPQLSEAQAQKILDKIER